VTGAGCRDQITALKDSYRETAGKGNGRHHRGGGRAVPESRKREKGGDKIASKKPLPLAKKSKDGAMEGAPRPTRGGSAEKTSPLSQGGHRREPKPIPNETSEFESSL